MKIVARLSVLVTAMAAGLTLVATGAAAAPATPAAPGAGHAAAVTSGTKLWEARYAASGRGAFSFASAVSPDGSTLFLTGQSLRKVKEPAAMAGTTLAYNTATGAKLWQSSYNPGGLSSSSFSAVAVSPDSSTVFVAGTTQPKVAGPSSVVVAAYDAVTGVARWTDTTAIAGAGNSITVSPDGSAVYVAGGADTVAYNAATGAPLWTEALTTQASFTANVAVSPDGSTVFVRSAGGTSNVVAAYNAVTGATVWTTTLVRIGTQSLAVSPDGSKVFVTGEFAGSSGTATAVTRTAALDAATGTVLWAKTFKSPNGGSYGNAVTVSPDSATVFVAGSTTTASKHAVRATWAFDAATGTTRWLKTLPGLIANNVIAVSPDGSRVFAATGGVGFSAAQAFSTVAYDAATGAEQWSLGYHAAGAGGWHSGASSIEVSPDGSEVFVTGDVNTPEPGTIATMAAVAYSS